MSEGTRKAYISYSRRSDYSFIQALLDVAGAENQLRSIVVEPSRDPAVFPLTKEEPENIDLDQWDLIYDEKGLDAFGTTEGFMEELSEGERVIILLSKGYFQSPYCMTELLTIYHKRAGNLVPIVAFVDGFSPSDLSIDVFLKYWEKRREDLQQAGKDKEARHAGQVHRYLRPALAWLLGRYDEKHGGWDTIFPVVDATEGERGAAQQMVQELSRERKPRYPYFSAKERRRQAKDEVEKILAERSTKEWFDRLAKRFSPSVLPPEEFAASLIGFESADELMNTLDHFVEWLEKDLQDVLANPASGQIRKQLAKDIKDILGWLLLLVMDDTRLYLLIHGLNRLDAEARQTLYGENESSFQLIASALAGSTARYILEVDPQGAPWVRGENQVDLIERGADQENYRRYIEDEDHWMGLKSGLLKRVVGARREHRTDASLNAAFSTALRRKKGTYLLVDGEIWKTVQCHGLLKMLGEKFPELHQIIDDDAAETAQAYFRDGVESGAIDQTIFDIYKKLHELIQ